jgi:hypothetical protein
MILLLGSALVGFMIAPRHNVYILAASSLILALVAAAGARISEFGLLASIAISFACLTASQMAYLLLLWLSMRHEGALADKTSDNQSGENGQSKVYNEQTQQNKPPTHSTR